MSDTSFSLTEFIAARCILRRDTDGPLYSKSGKRFSWALDLRRAILDQEAMAAIADTFIDAHLLEDVQLAGVEMSGALMVAAIQQRAHARGLHFNALTVRTKRKKHLQQGDIDGRSNGSPVVVVDDTLNSGRSMLAAVAKLRDAGLTIRRAFVVVDFDSESGVAARVARDLPLLAMYQAQHLGLVVKHRHAPDFHFETAWRFTSPKANLRFAVPKSTPVLYQDTLIFGSDCGTLWGLDVATGKPRWQVDTPDETGKGIISSPLLDHDGTVVYGNYSGQLMRVDAATGKVVNMRKVCDWIGSSPCEISGGYAVGLEFKTPPEQGAVAGFDYDFGLQWSVPLKKPNHCSPVYSAEHDAVVSGTNDGTMHALTSDGVAMCPPLAGLKAVKYHAALYKTYAVFGAFDGCVYVWDFTTGEVVFKYPTDDLVYCRPLIVEGRAFIGSSDHQFVVIDLDTLTLVSAFDVGEKVHSSPALIDGVVWFGTSRGELMGIDPDTLDLLYSYQIGERILSTPVAGPYRTIYVYDVTNTMHALRRA